jgi:hypothetical protein
LQLEAEELLADVDENFVAEGDSIETRTAWKETVVAAVVDKALANLLAIPQKNFHFAHHRPLGNSHVK